MTSHPLLILLGVIILGAVLLLRLRHVEDGGPVLRRVAIAAARALLKPFVVAALLPWQRLERIEVVVLAPGFACAAFISR